MDYRSLGRTDIKVSAIGLGTMTFGEQNTEAQGHEQLDYAVAQGVNLLDTAEVYSVPPRAETYGSTERIIGTWLKKRGQRDRIIVATKVAGPGAVLGVTHVRGGDNKLDRANIFAAVDASLQRLQTDYIDIYQMHWPSRQANFFGRLGYQHKDGAQTVAIEETLDAMSELVRAGKIRHVGLSNETPWGVSRKSRPCIVRIPARARSRNRPTAKRIAVGLGGCAPASIVGQADALFATTAAESIMGDKYRNPKKQRKLDGDKPERPYDEVEGGGARQYDSGRNPAMQAQRSDRQGSGKATQQRPEDR